MTELNTAFFSNYNNENFENFQDMEPPVSQQPPPKVQSKKPQPPPQKPQQEEFTNYEYEYQGPPPSVQQHQQQVQQQKRYPEYSFWDRMVMSKREVMKLFILSIVIILGISLEKIGFHYLTSYISNTDLTAFQEFLVRLSFPILVFIILWIIKSL
jgi:ABC-type bacteriocin/lantibiotic exporter with double-glycine peptidase domain